jgi:hypothetical protein
MDGAVRVSHPGLDSDITGERAHAEIINFLWNSAILHEAFVLATSLS